MQLSSPSPGKQRVLDIPGSASIIFDLDLTIQPLVSPTNFEAWRRHIRETVDIALLLERLS